MKVTAFCFEFPLLEAFYGVRSLIQLGKSCLQVELLSTVELQGGFLLTHLE